jgi:hypothetical protein
MTSSLGASRPSSRRRWWALVMLVLTVQLVLIFWLGETSPKRPRAAAPGLTLRLAGKGSAELLALRDPTLFVLPRPQGITRPGGLNTPRPEAHAVTWPEPTSYPPPALDEPGAAFTRFVASNAFNAAWPPATPPPRPTLPTVAPQPERPAQSIVRLEGDLVRRRLITSLVLPSQTNRDILRDSVVRLMVGAEGVPRSVTLLSGSGSPEADALALEQARGARFEALNRNPASAVPEPTNALSWGRMLFLWHTMPLPLTNPPPVKP